MLVHITALYCSSFFFITDFALLPIPLLLVFYCLHLARLRNIMYVATAWYCLQYASPDQITVTCNSHR